MSPRDNSIGACAIMGSRASSGVRMSHDFLSFFLAWQAAPRRVGAIAPSSEALAELITREITPASGPIIELGPGTGVFTYKLLQRGLKQQDLTLVEYGSEFVPKLQLRFPGARVLWMDASRMTSHRIAEPKSIGAVISGLPLLTMPARKVLAILGGAFHYLRPNGVFYQFTYGIRCPIHRSILDRLGLKATRLDHVVRNIPPATVYKLTRRAPSRMTSEGRQAVPTPPPSESSSCAPPRKMSTSVAMLGTMKTIHRTAGERISSIVAAHLEASTATLMSPRLSKPPTRWPVGSLLPTVSSRRFRPISKG
jgi:phosphatidylethanolamine/phosphatidyl-N-methylethanolamine N-methyltransferase